MSDIKYVIGDATHPEADPQGYARCIVHCCNDIGGWGSGFVLALNKLSAEPKRVYLEQNPYELGDVSYATVQDANGKWLWVANVIGQHGTANPNNPHPIRYDAIYTGLQTVSDYLRNCGFGLHMPRMGAGLAGGSWKVIEAIIEEVVPDDIPVTVYDLPVQL